MRELGLEHRKKTVSHPGIEPQRPRMDKPGAGVARFLEEGLEVGSVIRDAGQNRGDDQAGVDPASVNAERTQPHWGGGDGAIC